MSLLSRYDLALVRLPLLIIAAGFLAGFPLGLVVGWAVWG